MSTPTPFGQSDILKRTGCLVSLEVMGNGARSGHIEFTLATAGKANATFIVIGVLPFVEPQVFAGMAALFAAAYYAEKIIEISYYEVPGGTSVCTRITLPRRPPAT